MVVVPADHWVGDGAAIRRSEGHRGRAESRTRGGFGQSVRTAIMASCAEDAIATIGIRPTHPHPGLGYLCAGVALRTSRGGARVFRLARFVEKPSRTAARRLLRRSHTFWNSGMFIATADKFIECVAEWLPGHTQHLVPLANGMRRRSLTARARRAYRALKTISFDHGVMDHLHGALVVEGRFAWADLGSWDAWASLSENASGVLAVESRNVTAVSQVPHLVAAIGVQNLFVVHTPSATLICAPGKVQAVRKVVKRLAQDPRFAPYR